MVPNHVHLNHLNEHAHDQLRIDFRTGRPTAIHGSSISEAQWRACVDLNRSRAGGLLAAAREPASRESVPAHVWADIVARRTRTQEIPLISLDAFGFYRDEIGAVASHTLQRLGSGKEAVAWGDPQTGGVYKMFNLFLDEQKRGRLGQQLVFHMQGDFECSVSFEDADIYHVVEKLRILHEVGTCPTEIVGLTEGGYFLVAKQLWCQPYKDLMADRLEAVKAIHAVLPTGSYQQQIWVFWADGRPWAIGDLHRGNIMRMPHDGPTIIDALIGQIPDRIMRQVPEIHRAVMLAKRWKETGVLQSADLFANSKDEDF